MILVLDIGNTNIVMGVYERERLIASCRMATDRQKTADEYAMLIRDLFSYHEIDFSGVSGVAISCVVPPVIGTFEDLARRYFHCEPVVVGPGVRTGMVIRYENPKEVGADRIVNAVAAYERYGGPVIVVDFGTATTFCAISASGEYLGGAIAPGIGISSEALFARAAKLPRVELTKPRSVIGRSTVSSMQSGIIYGTVGLVDEIVKRMKREMGGDPRVIATGGFAPLIAEDSSEIDVLDPNLTLEGLRILFERNAPAQAAGI
ncbi:MAG: type III pantothenate kinase [Firmicutes bacterium]|nr:type III pantothenate kinase [Bacillota bacterium]MDH7496335.1 type III pantothenate kinase [Bacillota bacterium]